MKKSLKLFAATIAVSASSMAVKNVDAQVVSDNSSTDVWVKRNVVEVANSINKEIEETGKYTIQWGDTLSVVAEALGLSVEEITVINQIENPDLIVAGSTLSFDNENHLITFENEESGESVTYSTETGEEVEQAVVVEETATDGIVYNNVEEWVVEETVATEDTAAYTYEASEVTYPENLITWEETEEVVEEAILETPAVEELAEEEVVEEATVTEEVVAEVTPEVEETYETDLTVEEDATSWEAVEEVPAVETPAVEETVIEEPVYEEVVEEPVYEEPVYEEVVETPSTGSIDYYTASLAEMPENAHLSADELAAKLEIRRRESTHNYDVYSVSGNHYGAYQMLDSYFSTYGYGDTSPASQEAASNGYVASRYGSWQAALAHHNANNWY
ncbi:LysM peptidoglycan-binding domain-containing protein [Aerococcaceae bacterium WGS1372]